MSLARNRLLLRSLLVISVCLTTLMLMFSFKAATSRAANRVEVSVDAAVESKEAKAMMMPSDGDEDVWRVVHGGRFKSSDRRRVDVSRPTSKPASSLTMTTSTTTTTATTTANWTTSKSIVATDFSFVLEEPHICDRHRPDVFVLIYVHTAPNHFKHRAVIRRTWGDSKLYSRLRTVTMFFVGRSKDDDVEDAIAMESERYGDIVQADFVDSYRNLSVKAVVALRWIVEHCSGRPSYVVKVDDDMFVNVFNLVRHLHYLRRYNDERHDEAQGPSISCLVWKSMTVLRDPKSKWYVNKEEFSEERYPTYCSGSAFFMAVDVVARLYRASATAPYFWVDDVYATGILARQAGVEHTSINSIVTLSASKYDSQLIQGEAVFGHMTGDAGIDLRDNYWKRVVKKEVESATVF